MTSKAPIVLPPKGPHKGTIIFLHGLGDIGAGWSLHFEEIAPQFPHVKVVLPTAPVMPVALNFGIQMTAWHDVEDLATIDEETFSGLEDSKKIVTQMIEEEAKSGTPYDKIILGGFSQGAALSMFTAYQLPHTLAGVIALSGYLPHFGSFKKLITEEAKKTPLFIAHGSKDQVVYTSKGERAAQTLKEVGVENVQWKVYANVPHSSCPSEELDMEQFIASVLPK